MTTHTAVSEELRAKRIANLKPFKKGQSGNPTGKSKRIYTAADLAVKHAEKAVETLAKCLTNEKATWSAKVAAAAELLDRGFGKAPQHINQTVSFSEEFETYIRSLSAEKTAKVINGTVAREGGRLVEIAPPVRP